MPIYNFIRPEERGEIGAALDPLAPNAWDLPVWLPRLLTSVDHGHLLFQTLAQLDEQQRSAALFAIVALANKIAVADRMPLSDAESTPLALEKLAKFASSGLAFICDTTERSPVDVIANVTIERLFSVGANLDPEAAKPGLSL